VRKLTQDQFISKVTEVHGDYYDYSNTIYVNYRTKVTIVCPIHGEFSILADAHINGQGCKPCGVKRFGDSTRTSKEDIINKANKTHNNKFDYSLLEYNGYRDKCKIICPTHGIFEQNIYDHIAGKGCQKCYYEATRSNTLTQQEFEVRSNNVHNSFYSYAKSIYINCYTKVTITCPTHGDFEQYPLGHYGGSGCPKCAIENGGFNKSMWVNGAKNRVGTFYIIRCFNETESFYKYGITYVGLKTRYIKSGSMPYEYEIIRLIVSTDKEYIWDLEKRFGKIKRSDRYNPIIPFAGSINECFKTYTAAHDPNKFYWFFKYLCVININ